MQFGDYMTLCVIAVVVIAIITYLVKQKKKGVKCIGCPHGKSCGSCDCKGNK